MTRQQPETGQTTAAIYAKANQRGWVTILPALRAGAVLTRPSPKLRTYYVNGSGGLSPSFVRRMEREGLIRRVGVEAYQLVEFLNG